VAWLCSDSASSPARLSRWEKRLQLVHPFRRAQQPEVINAIYHGALRFTSCRQRLGRDTGPSDRPRPTILVTMTEPLFVALAENFKRIRADLIPPQGWGRGGWVGFLRDTPSQHPPTFCDFCQNDASLEATILLLLCVALSCNFLILHDLKSVDFGHAGSSPAPGTILRKLLFRSGGLHPLSYGKWAAVGLPLPA
jgi:hypothetical protein